MKSNITLFTIYKNEFKKGETGNLRESLTEDRENVRVVVKQKFMKKCKVVPSKRSKSNIKGTWLRF